MNFILKCNFLLVRPIKNLRSISKCYVTNKNDTYGLFHPEGHEPDIPIYKERANEDVKIKKARLIYQSRKRGMLENGLLLSTFAKKYLDSFNESQLKLYDQLINLPSNDWDLFYWASGVKQTPPEFDNEIMDLLKAHVQNEDKQTRFIQPNL